MFSGLIATKAFRRDFELLRTIPKKNLVEVLSKKKERKKKDKKKNFQSIIPKTHEPKDP